MKLSELGEFGLIERIRRQAPKGPDVHRGIGDDAAEMSLPSGHHLLTSTDLLIEDIHFRRDWTDGQSLGHKAVAVNLSDLAAMGATPRYLYLGLACPGDTDQDEIADFLKGVLDQAGKHKVILAGGDTCRSPGPWIISVTVEGSAPANQSIGRNGAQPGDLIMVSGTLGDSALALHLLSKGMQPEASLLERHLRPKAQIELGCLLSENRLASAMIDVSDGLAGDLEHILQASKVDGLIEEARLPLSEAFMRITEQHAALRELALHGGEDYELLFTVHPDRAAEVVRLCAERKLPVTAIGTIGKGSGGLILRDRSAAEKPILVRGYDHFCRFRD